MFKESFDFSCFKPRKSSTKQMQYEDAIRRRHQEIPYPKEEGLGLGDSKELPLPPLLLYPSLNLLPDNMLSSSAFEIPI